MNGLHFGIALVVCAAAEPIAAQGASTLETISCGPSALAVAGALNGRQIDDAALREAFRGRVGGVHSLAEIADAARALGLCVRLVRLNASSDPLARLPVIVCLKRRDDAREADHFIVLYGEKDQSSQVLDYPHAPHFVARAGLAELWNGTGLYVARSCGDLPSEPFYGGYIAMVLAFGGVATASTAICLLVTARRDRAKACRRA